MRARALNILMGAAMLVGVLGPAAPALAAPSAPDYKLLDIGPVIRGWDATQARIQGGPAALNPQEIDALEAEAMEASAGTPYSECVLDAKFWLSLDSVEGVYFFDLFYLVAETTGSELWVQSSLSWPAGDPRAEPQVTCEQAAYLLGQFDGNIYPTEADFFGTPNFHDGNGSLLEEWGAVPPDYYDNAAGRQVVLVSNVIDEAYYDPDYPNYIAGFYSPSFEAYFDRNVMSIDSYEWEERIGPDGDHPYVYEGVFAHEYQHLLHDDYDSDEVELINEGLAMFAEYLTGYTFEDDAYSTFEEMPENSLVAWEDQGGEEAVADYGVVYLFQMYLYEKFGQKFIQHEFHNPDNGISSVNSSLAAFHVRKDFGDLYHDFSVAVLIDSKQDKYRYGFKLLNVGIDIGTPADPNEEAYDTPGAPPWGGDYLWITGKPKDLGCLTFNGVNYSTFKTGWTSDGSALWGGKGDLVDNWAIFSATGGGQLTFDTKYDIEAYWDFGFVQVSTDGGYTWTSLANEYTTSDYDPSAHPTVIANLPGLTGSTDGAWVPMTFDLSAYAGQDILLAFRYVTDWATSEAGWFVDNVSVDGNLVSDGSDASVFKDITEIVPINNDFTVTFVSSKGSGKSAQYKIKTLRLDHETEDGWIELGSILKWGKSAVMIVTFDAPEGVEFYADYTYELTYRHSKPHSQPPVHGHPGDGTHFENPGHHH